MTAEKLQKSQYEGKGTEKKKELGGRKEEKRKKAMATPLEFVIATLAEKKNCWTQKVHLAITFLKNPARFTLQYFIYICCIVTKPYNAKSWRQSGVILIQEGT